MKLIKILFFIYLIVLSSCSSKKRYVNRALNIMEKYSINKDSVDWDILRKNTLKEINAVNSISETHPILQNTLRELKDNHSSLIPLKYYEHIISIEKPLPQIKNELLKSNIGYIKIPGFLGTPTMTKNFALEIQKTIKTLDNKNIKGWIVDLSENYGGNMWPMVLGLGPILKDGTCGFFVNNKNEYTPWDYSKGKVFDNSHLILKIENPYTLKNNENKVAVLIGSKTLSSGEATAIAFIGNDNTKLFGQKSGGNSTGNESIKLSDGAMLYLTTTKFVDRNMKIYGKSITPDHKTFFAKEKAIEWILK